jgi:uncharacterized protein YecE (DUF72 family)
MIRVGISGWRYEPWRGVFYPPGLPQRCELEYAARIFSTIEINGSFYSLQRPASWRDWYASTPASFVFTVKGPRFITHMTRLREPLQPLANFFASGLLALREKLGPILWQFPPNMKFDADRLAAFLQLLPHDTAAALSLARRRDARLRGRSVLSIDESRPLRHAIEVRHESFLDPRFTGLLREHSVALVIAETARKWPMPRDVTADFMYLRLHGDKELYRSGYRAAAIARWARRIECWHAGTEPARLPQGAVRIDQAHTVERRARDVYCFFDNTDVKLRAPHDAQALMKELGLPAGSPSVPLTETGISRSQLPRVRRAAGRATVRSSSTGRRLRG